MLTVTEQTGRSCKTHIQNSVHTSTPATRRSCQTKRQRPSDHREDRSGLHVSDFLWMMDCNVVTHYCFVLFFLHFSRYVCHHLLLFSLSDCSVYVVQCTNGLFLFHDIPNCFSWCAFACFKIINVLWKPWNEEGWKHNFLDEELNKYNNNIFQAFYRRYIVQHAPCPSSVIRHACLTHRSLSLA